MTTLTKIEEPSRLDKLNEEIIKEMKIRFPNGLICDATGSFDNEWNNVEQFLIQSLKKVADESRREVVEIVKNTSKLDTTAHWNDFDREHRTMSLEEIGFEEGFNEALDEIYQKLSLTNEEDLK